ncbi:hypothetical protein [Anaeromassilibacillus sp. SJQ-1]
MDFRRIDAYLQGASLDGYQDLAHILAMNTIKMARALRCMRRMLLASC